MPRGQWPERGNVPWSGGLIHDNPFDVARLMGGRGATEAQIQERLGRWPVDIRGGGAGRAAELGARWGSRIRHDQASNVDARAPRSWLIVRPNTPSAYRWYIDVDFGVGPDGTRNVRTVVVDTDRIPSYTELYELAEQVYRDVSENYRRFRELELSDETLFTVVFATRRS